MIDRNPNIDLLRGIAIVAVLLLHHALSYGFRGSIVADILPKSWLHNLVINGGYGVTMFFTISGFLITSIALRRYGNLERMDVWHFYRLRAARILPPLLLALLIIVLLALAGLDDFRNGHQLPDSYLIVAVFSVLTFWHNLLMQYQGWFNYALNVYWSLSVEELFYLLFPLACILLKSNRYFVMIAFLLIVIGPAYRWLHLDSSIDYRYGYLACFDALSFGVLAVLVQQKVSKEIMRPWRMAAIVGLPVIYFSGIHGNVVFGFSGISLCTAIILIHISKTQTEFWARVTLPLRWMGRHSYELYLYHIIVLGIMRSAIPPETVTGNAKLLMLAVMLGFSCLVSYAVAHWFAIPSNRWLRRNISGT